MQNTLLCISLKSLEHVFVLEVSTPDFSPLEIKLSYNWCYLCRFQAKRIINPWRSSEIEEELIACKLAFTLMWKFQYGAPLLYCLSEQLSSSPISRFFFPKILYKKSQQTFGDLWCFRNFIIWIKSACLDILNLTRTECMFAIQIARDALWKAGSVATVTQRTYHLLSLVHVLHNYNEIKSLQWHLYWTAVLFTIPWGLLAFRCLVLVTHCWPTINMRPSFTDDF